MEEANPEIPTTTRTPRRQFLKRLGPIAAAAAAYGIAKKVGIDLGNPSDNSENSQPTSASNENNPKQKSPINTASSKEGSKKAAETAPFKTEEPTPLPPGLPKDTISPEQLQRQHIRVIQTEQVKLYLRENISEFQLFNDAKNGKINEAVIVLVDASFLVWNMNNEVPKEARQIF